MKKTLRRIILPLASLLFVAAGISSCEKNYYSGADFFTDEYTVENARAWEYNERYQRYEFIFDNDNIDSYIIRYGGVIGSVYVDEIAGNTTVTTLKQLPFVQTYYYDNLDEYITETISFDISLGSIAFYIQTSVPDMGLAELQRYRFKVNVFFRD